MKNLKRIICLSSVVAWFALGAGSAWSAQSGNTATGNNYVSGGVSDEELVELHSKRGAYSLWVVTAAKKTGAHLADAKVRIRNANRQVVFDGLLDGPWLFIDLPPGRHEVQASLNGETTTRVTTLRRGDHRQIFFYFDTGDDVSPDYSRPFTGNPYGVAGR